MKRETKQTGWILLLVATMPSLCVQATGTNDATVLHTGIIPPEYRRETTNSTGFVWGFTNRLVNVRYRIHVGRPMLLKGSPVAPDDKWALIAIPYVDNDSSNAVTVRSFVSFLDRQERLLGCVNRACTLLPDGSRSLKHVDKQESLPNGDVYVVVPERHATNAFWYVIRVYVEETKVPTR